MYQTYSLTMATAVDFRIHLAAVISLDPHQQGEFPQLSMKFQNKTKKTHIYLHVKSARKNMITIKMKAATLSVVSM